MADTDTTDLTVWLRAQLDDDSRRIAQHPDDEDDWMAIDDLVAETEQNYPCNPYLRIGKKRALAEVDAKRQILDLHAHTAHPYTAGVVDCDVCTYTGAGTWCGTVRALALPYAARPGYQHEWMP